MTVVEKLADDVFDLPANVLPVAIVGHTIATVGVNIEAQTIETIRVDIAAQTVDKIAIDIAAQTLSEVNVNLAAQTVTVNVATAVGEHVDTDIVSSVTLPISIQSQAVTLDVDIAAQTLGNLTIDIAAQSVGNVDINFADQSDAVENRKEFQEATNALLVNGAVAGVTPGYWALVAQFTVPAGYKYRVFDVILSGTQKAKWRIVDNGTGPSIGYRGEYQPLQHNSTMALVFTAGTWSVDVYNEGASSGDFIALLQGWS